MTKIAHHSTPLHTTPHHPSPQVRPNEHVRFKQISLAEAFTAITRTDALMEVLTDMARGKITQQQGEKQLDAVKVGMSDPKGGQTQRLQLPLLLDVYRYLVGLGVQGPKLTEALSCSARSARMLFAVLTCRQICRPCLPPSLCWCAGRPQHHTQACSSAWQETGVCET